MEDVLLVIWIFSDQPGSVCRIRPRLKVLLLSSKPYIYILIEKCIYIQIILS